MKNHFSEMHGCSCSSSGRLIARRGDTRKWEVDIEHDNGQIHTNVIVFEDGSGATMTRKSDERGTS